METVVIIFAWMLNAVMDAIDHGKGSRTLYELWHLFKAMSYFSLISFIFLVCRTPILVIIVTLVLMYNWELVYRFCRKINIQELDDRFRCKYLAWLWGIKRE